ncbi:MAG: hypothetical protein Q8L57_02930 [bacterium]|nr:hypothetical protein [bacterium]
MKSIKIIPRNLRQLYLKKCRSVFDIAKKFHCSENKINYWLRKFKIPKRSISEAIYIKNNPKGDPFKFVEPKDFESAKLFGLGLGLYWGEGNKANKTTVRLGNSDPNLLKAFIKFLTRFFCIDKKDLKFHLHIFSDIDVKEAQDYWMKQLAIKKSQFYKPFVTKSGKLGTYRVKSRYGVLTLYYGNVKLKNILINLLPL